MPPWPSSSQVETFRDDARRHSHVGHALHGASTSPYHSQNPPVQAWMAREQKSAPQAKYPLREGHAVAASGSGEKATSPGSVVAPPSVAPDALADEQPARARSASAQASRWRRFVMALLNR